MATEVTHRGPDAGGVRVYAGAGLAHRRLSILDLSDAAAQPFESPDGRVAIVFNGEIYNFSELRRGLEAKGHSFRSSGDTEVVLRLYLEYGADAIQRLDGMFALGIWDDTKRRLLLARDRTGEKPLYVYEDSTKILFASEIKSILTHPDVDRAMNPEAVPQYLSHGYVPTPGTFYRRIRKFPPATLELFPAGGTSSGPKLYWDFPMAPPQPLDTPAALHEAESRTRDLFHAAVKRRLVADVPLGAFLSGGIDSSLVVAAMAQASPTPVKTFTIGFEGYPEWDETHYARIVAKRWGTDHTEFKVNPASFDLVEKLAWHLDEPFGDSSAIPTFIVSSLAREQVKVVLTGDGGDEIYAGYTRFLAGTLAERIPARIRSLLGLLGRLPTPAAHRATFARLQRLASQVSKPLPERMRGWLSIFDAEELRRLLVPELAAHVSAISLGRSYSDALAHTRGADPLNAVLYLNARTYLLDDLNVKVDRASMAASLETRSPFLDTALMEHAFALPGPVKLRGRTQKWILKRSMRDLLPDEVVKRKKMGFGVPLGAWFRDELKGFLEARLLASGTHLHALVDVRELERMFEQHHGGLRDYGQQFWALWILELWLRRESAAR